MDAPTFPFTEDELNKSGLLGEGVSGSAALAVDTMKKHPELLSESFNFFLRLYRTCHLPSRALAFCARMQKGPSSPHSPVLSDQPISSHLSTLSFASEATIVSEHTPDEYERTTYYNGITGDGDHPELVYHSDFHTTPFPKPVGRHAHIPVKSLHGVFDTPLNGVWDTVGPQIRDLIKAQNIRWSSINPARFFTHGPPGEEEKGSLGPVVIWVGVLPGTTSPDTAHDVSQQILALLLKNGVEDVVVEWREAVPQKLAGSPLRHVS